jgi:hypothetical protein
MAERVQFITHRGKEVLSIDFSATNPDEMLQLMETAKRIISQRPEGSVRTLTNVERAHYNRVVSDAMKDYVAHNKPYVLAGAVVGLDGLKTVIFNFLNRVTGRTLKAFEDVDSAKNWLANY